MKEVNDNSLKEVFAQHKLVVVKYFAEWCGMCRILSPRLERIALGDSYQDICFVALNTEHNPLSKSQYQIKALPTLQTFYKGELRKTITSIKEEDICSILDDLINLK